MPTLRFAFLSVQEMPLLHKTFLKAFADYLVPIQLTEEQFRLKIKREGIEPTFSVAAFDGSQMVGFILTGIGEWQGRPTAYNAGTGVLPAYRGHHLTQRLYTFLLPKLRQSGIEYCLLEVIRENAAALKSYQRVGFRITRTLACFRARKEELNLTSKLPAHSSISKALTHNWPEYSNLINPVQPSWQNTLAAAKRSKTDCVILEARDSDRSLLGYCVFYPATGAVAQLAVANQLYDNGIGDALLQETATRTSAPALLFINIDDARLTGYLQHLNFKRILTQHEMLLPINP